MYRTLRKYQKPMLRYLLKVQHGALYVQMRLGKTIVCIRTIKIKNLKHILIVCPNSAIFGWERELQLENQYEKGIINLQGTRQYRSDLLKNHFYTTRWFLINKEGYLALPELVNYPFDGLVLDESTFIKGAYSTRKGCGVSRFYCENFRKVSHRYILTGTPAPEGEMDYYNQLRFLDHNNWKEKNYWAFKHKNFGTIAFRDYITPEASKYLEDVLARNCYFLTRNQVKLGGKKIFETRTCKMTKRARAMYNRAEKEMVLEWGGGRLDTIFATTKYIWLRRLCGGFADKEFISYAKLNELFNLLTNELKDEPTIIICKHKNEVEKVCKFLRKHWRVEYIHGGITKKQRVDIQKKFMNSELDHIVAQPDTIAYGVDLSRSDTLIVYTAPDKGVVWMQVQDRIINTATNDASLIVFLIMENTIEGDKILNLEGKESTQDMTRRSVQRLQRKYGLIK